MEKASVLLAGICVLTIGSMIIVFDYPQILRIEGIEPGTILDPETASLHQRVWYEFAAGIGLAVSGAALVAFSGFGRLREMAGK